MDDDTQSIIVVSEEGRKFKMVMRGSLDKLSVEKIKRYLAKSTSIEPTRQLLTHQGRALTDNMIGEDFNLRPDDILHLSTVADHKEAPFRREEVAETPRQAERRLVRDELGRQRQQQQQQQSVPGPSTAASMIRRHEDPNNNDNRTALPYASTISPVQSTRSHIDGYPTLRQGLPAIDPEHPLMTKITALEADNRSLRQQIEKLKKEAEHRTFLQPSQGLTIVATARANLDELSKELGVHLSFDDNLSCVVGVDESNTLILTVDPPTERMYLYSTLSTSIPSDPVLRLRLFENLLEWSMLGRDMAGGGVGIDPRSGLILMATSIDLKHANAFALRDTAPLFVECLARWRAAVAAVGPPSGVGPHRTG